MKRCYEIVQFYDFSDRPRYFRFNQKAAEAKAKRKMSGQETKMKFNPMQKLNGSNSDTKIRSTTSATSSSVYSTQGRRQVTNWSGIPPQGSKFHP